MEDAGDGSGGQGAGSRWAIEGRGSLRARAYVRRLARSDGWFKGLEYWRQHAKNWFK